MPDTVDLDVEERWSRGTAVGEAVWIRLCRASGQDPKDDSLDEQHGRLVDAVREAAMAMDRAGMEGLADWLEMEEWRDL
jgi:hypothetical protein